MKVLILLFFINTVYMFGTRYDPYVFFYKNFSAYNAAIHTHSREFANNNQYSQSAYHIEPPSRSYERSFPDQDNNDRSAGLHVRTRQTQSTAVPGERRSEAIVYPQSYPTAGRGTNITGYNCNFDLCEDAADYPSEYIKAILNSTRAFDAFFNTSRPDLWNKVDFGAENLCSSTLNTTYPRIAVNMKQEKRFIANIDQYQQGIKIETCNGKGGTCKFSEFWPLDYESVCEQRFTVTPLLALDEEMNPVVDTFQTPSCCVCMYKHT